MFQAAERSPQKNIRGFVLGQAPKIAHPFIVITDGNGYTGQTSPKSVKLLRLC